MAKGEWRYYIGNKRIDLHKFQNEFDSKSKLPVPGSEDLCFIAQTGLKDAISHLKNRSIEVIEGPVKRTGATGSIVSFCFRDPDGSLIEISNYT